MLDRLGPGEQRRLIEVMQTIEGFLGAPAES